MVSLCKEYLGGTCPYGLNCKYSHCIFSGPFGTRTFDVTCFQESYDISGLVAEASEVDEFEQWLVSHFLHAKERLHNPWMNEISQEEVRWKIHQTQQKEFKPFESGYRLFPGTKYKLMGPFSGFYVMPYSWHKLFDDSNTLIKEYKKAQDLILRITSGVLDAHGGRQWPLSCFGPLKGQPCIPGFVDLSPEEARWIWCSGTKTTIYVLERMVREMKARREILTNPLPRIKTILENLSVPKPPMEPRLIDWVVLQLFFAEKPADNEISVFRNLEDAWYGSLKSAIEMVMIGTVSGSATGFSRGRSIGSISSSRSAQSTKSVSGNTTETVSIFGDPVFTLVSSGEPSFDAIRLFDIPETTSSAPSSNQSDTRSFSIANSSSNSVIDGDLIGTICAPTTPFGLNSEPLISLDARSSAPVSGPVSTAWDYLFRARTLWFYSITRIINIITLRFRQRVNSPSAITHTAMVSGESFQQTITQTGDVIDETALTVENKGINDKNSSSVEHQLILGELPIQPPVIDIVDQQGFLSFLFNKCNDFVTRILQLASLLVSPKAN